MSWMRHAGLGFIAALYVLAGRWGLDRLVLSEPDHFLELRLWIVTGGLVLAAMGLIQFSHHRQRPGETRLDTRLLTALLLFFGYLCLSALWAPNADFALTKLFDVALAAVMTVAFALAALRQRATRVLDTFWTVVVAATALLALAGMSQLLGSGGSARLAVLGGGPNVFARLMGLLTLGSLYFWYRRGQAWLWIPLAATGVLLALLTGSRGGSAAIVAGILIFLVVGRVPLRRLAILSLLATAAVGVATMLSPLGKALDRAVEERFLRLTLKYEKGNAGQSKVYLSGREHLYVAAYELGLEHPVSGAGLAAFPALRLGGPYPHNLFLEVFCEGGVLGLGLLAWVLLTFLRSAYQGRHGLDGATVGAAALILIGSQSSGDLYDSRALYLLMVMATCTSVGTRRAASAIQPQGDSPETEAPASPPPSTYPAVPGAM